MHFIIIILVMLVIALALVPICLHINILIKDFGAKRCWIFVFVLMMLALSLASIIDAKTGSVAAGLIYGLSIYTFGFLPILYIDYLKKSNSSSYKGAWQKVGDWLDQPIRYNKTRKIKKC